MHQDRAAAMGPRVEGAHDCNAMPTARATTTAPPHGDRCAKGAHDCDAVPTARATTTTTAPPRRDGERPRQRKWRKTTAMTATMGGRVLTHHHLQCQQQQKPACFAVKMMALQIQPSPSQIRSAMMSQLNCNHLTLPSPH